MSSPTVSPAKAYGDKYEFTIKMACGGCSRAVNNKLLKMQDQGIVKDFTVSLEDQSALVYPAGEKEATTPFANVYEELKKTGKDITDGKVDDVPRPLA